MIVGRQLRFLSNKNIMCADKEFVTKTKPVFQKKYKFKWTIEDFSLVQIFKENHRDSPVFPSEESDISFRLRMSYRYRKLIVTVLPRVRDVKNIKYDKYSISLSISSNNEWKFNDSSCLPNSCSIVTELKDRDLVKPSYDGNYLQ